MTSIAEQIDYVGYLVKEAGPSIIRDVTRQPEFKTEKFAAILIVEDDTRYHYVIDSLENVIEMLKGAPDDSAKCLAMMATRMSSEESALGRILMAVISEKVTAVIYLDPAQTIPSGCTVTKGSTGVSN